VAKKGAKGPIFEGNMLPQKMYPKNWRQYWRHNRNPVNGIKFLISHSKHIGLLQTYCVRKNNRDAILSCILKMIQTYKSRSVFNVITIEADGAFQSIKHELHAEPYNIALTTCNANRHGETVERQIRFLKEQIRSVRIMMPYNKTPKRFTIEMVHRITILINSLPKQNGIHSILSPREIVTGKKFQCPSIKIGQYFQGHTGGTNSTDQERSIDSFYALVVPTMEGGTLYLSSAQNNRCPLTGSPQFPPQKRQFRL
jgi:hypothetical protein